MIPQIYFDTKWETSLKSLSGLKSMISGSPGPPSRLASLLYENIDFYSVLDFIEVVASSSS